MSISRSASDAEMDPEQHTSPGQGPSIPEAQMLLSYLRALPKDQQPGALEVGSPELADLPTGLCLTLTVQKGLVAGALQLLFPEFRLHPQHGVVHQYESPQAIP